MHQTRHANEGWHPCRVAIARREFMGASLRWGDVMALIVAAFVAVMLALTPAHAQNFPKLTGRVVDEANLLSPAQEAELSGKSEALEQRTGRQFVIATVSSLGGREIEEFATGLFRNWGIGDEQRDDGVLLLIAPAERKVRIENGYGAEAYMTDIVSGRIIRNSILPRFKSNDLPGGIAAGADEIISMMELPPEEAARRAQEIGAQETRRQRVEINPIPIIFIVIVFFVIIGSIARAAGGRRYRGQGRRRGGLDSGDVAVILWGLEALTRGSRGGGGGWGGGGWGGGGGGFGGFSGGGGWSGGGGASGSW